MIHSVDPTAIATASFWDVIIVAIFGQMSSFQ
jgi:hypothetical protein